MKSKLYIYLLFVFFNIIASSQSYSYKHYTIFDGLTQNQTKEIYQDSKGFIWISNKNGIDRFDGKSFVNYDISHVRNRITTKFFEFKNHFFCLTESDLLYLNDNKFISVFKSEIPIIDIDFNEDTSKIFLLTHQEIYEISNNQKIKHYDLSKYRHLTSSKYIPNNGLLISSRFKVLLLDKKNKLKTVYNKNAGSIVKSKDNRIFFIMEDINNDPIIKNQKGAIYEYIYGDLKQIYSNPNKKIETKLKLLEDNRLVFFEDRSTWNIIDFDGNLICTDEIYGQELMSCYKDKDNKLWFSSENGIFYLMSYAFRNYDEKSGMPKYIWSIFEDKDSNMIFASFYSDLVKLKNNNIINLNHYKDDIGTKLSFYMGGFTNSLGQWMIPAAGRILVHDKGKFSSLLLLNNNINSTALSTYEDTTTQKVYFGTNHGLFVYDLIADRFEHFETESNILDIEKDKFGRLWICTSKGVLLFKDGNFENFKNGENIVDKGVVSAKKDSYGNMWLAKRSGLILHTYKQEFKILDNVFHFIELYKEKYIIAGSILGIYLIDLQKFYSMKGHSILYFDRFNGFTGIESGQNGSFVDSKGNVWIPTASSVVKLMPEKLTIDSLAPPTMIYSIEVSKRDFNWKELELKTLNLNSHVKINHKTNNLKIQYHGIEFNCPERVKYKYRLVGYNDNWISTNNETAIFANLKPGKYKFELMSCNENNYCSETTEVFITIKPAFWQTWIFRIITSLTLISLIIFLISSYFKSKEKKQKRERQIKKDLLQMQLNTINAQLDPHFVFNSITAISYLVQDDNKDVAYSYFVKLSRLLRDSLSTRKQITRTLEEELEFVSNYLCLQKLRFGDRFKYIFEISQNTDYSFLVPKMCIQIFVENALKHGLEPLPNNGKLTITINFDDKGFYSIVQDNGIGRAAAKLKNNYNPGIGIQSFVDFFDLLNQLNTSKASFSITDLDEKTNSNTGTRVELFIPYNYKYN